MTGSEHPTLEELADLAAGLLTPGAARRMTEHTSTCPDCADALDAVSEVSATLAASAREPVVMPADVLIAIDAALGRAAQGSTASVATLPDRQASGRSAAPRRRAWAQLAAAAAVVVALGALGSQLIDPSSGGDPTAASTADHGTNMSAPGGPHDAANRPEMSGGGRKNLAAASPLAEADVASYARRLAKRTHAVAGSACDRPLTDAAFPTSAAVRWKGNPALLVLHRDERKALILGCGADHAVLFSTGY